MKLRAVLLTILPLAFAAWLWRRRPATRLDDDIQWSAWDPWLEQAGRV